MKISNGSTIEFTIAVLMVILGGLLLKIVGILVLLHCIYLWLQIRKKNKLLDIDRSSIEIYEKNQSKRYLIIIFILLIMNILQIFGIMYTINQNTEKDIE